MFKLFFLNLWSNIKRSPIISLILFIQIVLFSYGMFISLYEQSQLEMNNESFQRIYSKYSNYTIMCNPEKINTDRLLAHFGSTYVSPDNTGFELLEALYEEILNYEEIQTASFYRTQLNLFEEFDSIPMNEETSSYYSFYQPIESIPPTYQPNTYSIDRNFIDIFGLTLDSGRLFTDEEYVNLDPDCVPVLMGSDYKNYFSIGDTFEGTLFLKGKPMTFKIIGFIAENQIFLTPGNSDTYYFNNHIILPKISKTIAEWLEFQEENSEYCTHKSSALHLYVQGLGTSGLTMDRYLLVELGKEKEFVDRMNQIFDKINDDGFYTLLGRPATSMQISDNVEEKDLLLTTLVSTMLVFALASIVFAEINNASNNIKTYAIHNLIGGTRIQILLFSVFDSLVFCLLGFPCGFYAFYSHQIKWDMASHPAMKSATDKWLAISIIFTVISCILCFIFVYFKIKRYSVAELIRGREVKKASGLPLYKGLTFFMFLLSSICITFVYSYNWQIEHIDKYQNHFWGKMGYNIYLSAIPSEEKPIITFDYDIEGVEDYSIDVMVNLSYTQYEAPRIRGWYRKGDMETPEVISGRFFTEEELNKITSYAVVGKNVLNEFCVEEDGAHKFTYQDQTYEVIGIVGREGHDTTLDDWVFITVPTALKKHAVTTSLLFLVDGKTEQTISDVKEHIKTETDGKFGYTEMTIRSQIDLGISKYTLTIFAILIFLTMVVFCIYYIDKIKLIINIKKFLGYSRSIIFTDTAAQFIVISTAAFASGNALMWILSKTILKDFILFSAFRINLPVLTFSFGMIILISFIFSVIAINKAFRGSARDLKKD